MGITVRFECTLSVVRAIIDTADDYGLPNEQQEFQGENAIGKCLAWAGGEGSREKRDNKRDG